MPFELGWLLTLTIQTGELNVGWISPRRGTQGDISYRTTLLEHYTSLIQTIRVLSARVRV